MNFERIIQSVNTFAGWYYLVKWCNPSLCKWKHRLTNRKQKPFLIFINIINFIMVCFRCIQTFKSQTHGPSVWLFNVQPYRIIALAYLKKQKEYSLAWEGVLVKLVRSKLKLMAKRVYARDPTVTATAFGTIAIHSQRCQEPGKEWAKKGKRHRTQSTKQISQQKVLN